MSEDSVQQIRVIIEEARDSLRDSMNLAIETEVKKHINPLEVRFDKHLENIEPFLTGLATGKVVIKLTLWLCGGIVAVGSAVLTLREILK